MPQQRRRIRKRAPGKAKDPTELRLQQMQNQIQHLQGVVDGLVMRANDMSKLALDTLEVLHNVEEISTLAASDSDSRHTRDVLCELTSGLSLATQEAAKLRKAYAAKHGVTLVESRTFANLAIRIANGGRWGESSEGTTWQEELAAEGESESVIEDMLNAGDMLG